MNFEILVDGQSIVKVDFNLALLVKAVREAAKENQGAAFNSTAATQTQMLELLSRIDGRSVKFLKALAASEEGSITWKKMREIFGIEAEDDWAAYSGSFGKGITRAYRNILDDRKAKLVWWNDEDWDNHEWDDDLCCVYIDGPALEALQAAIDK